MKSYIVISAIGTDRTGFIEAVSDYLARLELNIEESRAAVLGKEFAFSMLISGERAAIEAFIRDKNIFTNETGIDELIIRETEESGARKLSDALPYKLEATSLDHSGIVHQLTAVLHSYNVNIESMKTHVAPAPITGTPVFSLTASVYLPAEVKISELRDKLHEISNEFNIDISFQPQSG